MTYTRSATIERARAVVKQLHERNHSTWNELDRETVHAINALVAYADWLRAQQQEPVAYMVKAHGMLQRLSCRADVADEIACQYRKEDPNAEMFPLYTTPPQPEPVIDKSAAVRIATSLGWEPKRKPLTDEEIEFIYADTGYNDIQMFARAIEAAHGIKE